MCAYIKLDRYSKKLQKEKKKQMKEIKIILLGIALMQLGIFLVLYSHSIDIKFEYYGFKTVYAGIVVCVIGFIYPVYTKCKEKRKRR